MTDAALFVCACLCRSFVDQDLGDIAMEFGQLLDLCLKVESCSRNMKPEFKQFANQPNQGCCLWQRPREKHGFRLCF